MKRRETRATDSSRAVARRSLRRRQSGQFALLLLLPRLSELFRDRDDRERRERRRNARCRHATCRQQEREEKKSQEKDRSHEKTRTSREEQSEKDKQSEAANEQKEVEEYTPEPCNCNNGFFLF
jgi:hypothetical protein